MLLLAEQMYEYVVDPLATLMTEALPRNRPRTDGCPDGREEKCGFSGMSEYVGPDVTEGVTDVTNEDVEDINASVLVAKLDGFAEQATRAARPRKGIKFAMSPEE
jgi:hypothetical protein